MGNSRPFYPFRKLRSHIDLCAPDGIHGKIEKMMSGTKYGHTNIFPQLAEFTCSRDASQGEQGFSGRGLLYVQQAGGMRTASQSFE